MAAFDVTAGEQFGLEIQRSRVDFVACEHPNAPGMAHVMEGGKAQVFRITDVAKRMDYALKVMKGKHGNPELVEVCARLQQLSTLRGMAACERVCLTEDTAREAVQRFRNLRYSILMPWITGSTWFDAVRSRRPVQQDEALHLAVHLADVLGQLEDRQLAHCDISGANVIFDPSTAAIALIDVEDIYGPGFSRPRSVSKGTPGYQHCTSGHGQWAAEADRFAGALLLSEILAWHDPDVRAAACEESYFDPRELQQGGCARYLLLHEAVAAIDDELGGLLERAWRSRSLADCPALAEWRHRVHIAAGLAFEWNKLEIPDEPSRRSRPITFIPLPAQAPQQSPVAKWKRLDPEPAPAAGPTPFWRRTPS